MSTHISFQVLKMSILGQKARKKPQYYATSAVVMCHGAHNRFFQETKLTTEKCEHKKESN